jgi:REP element-mobilizing transposase RayT
VFKKIEKFSHSTREHYKLRHRYEHWYVDNQVYFITARCRQRFPAFTSDEGKRIFWDRFEHYSKEFEFSPFATSLLNNHYHALGYLREGRNLKLLMQRLHGSVAKLVNDFKQYFTAAGQKVSENPSPGNQAGGITTLEEKSLGAVQKAGDAPLTQVLRYGERISRPGLALLEAPGNDAVSSTALAAAGATVLLFTTGRGTPLGFPTPTLKISSNSALARAKPRWIDFDAGSLLSGSGMDELAERLLELVVATASGRPTCAERNGEREVAIWKTGVTL